MTTINEHHNILRSTLEWKSFVIDFGKISENWMSLCENDELKVELSKDFCTFLAVPKLYEHLVSKWWSLEDIFLSKLL